MAGSRPLSGVCDHRRRYTGMNPLQTTRVPAEGWGKGTVQLFEGELIRAKRQGISVCELLLDRSGRRWQWHVVRMSGTSGALVHVHVVAKGWARSRDNAINAVRTLCDIAMKQNQAVDRSRLVPGGRKPT